jgi:release factor glutamine methyltransferase
LDAKFTAIDAYYCSMTVQMAFQQLQTQLRLCYSEREATNIAHLVFEHLTGWSRTERIIHKAVVLTTNQQFQLQRYTQELLQHRPLQYVLSEAWFAGKPFYVQEGVLIPRPETDELVAWILETVLPQPTTVLEVGVGSGCISIALKLQWLQASIKALDISDTALGIAKKNAELYKADIDFVHMDFLNESLWPQLHLFQVIVSNPPYITEAEKASMHPNVLQYEPEVALFVPNETPLLFYEKIAKFGKMHLTNKGYIFVEINEAYGEATKQVFLKAGYQQVILKQDAQGKDRMLLAQL